MPNLDVLLHNYGIFRYNNNACIIIYNIITTAMVVYTQFGSYGTESDPGNPTLPQTRYTPRHPWGDEAHEATRP